MNVETFAKYIKNPSSIPVDAIEQLEKVVEQYPYFQVAHILYIKALYLNKSIRYADQLKVAAIYAGDRKLLFNLIKGGAPKKETTVIVENEQEDKKDVGVDDFNVSAQDNMQVKEIIVEDLPIEKAPVHTVEELETIINNRLHEIEESEPTAIERKDNFSCHDEIDTEKGGDDDILMLDFDYAIEEEAIDESLIDIEKNLPKMDIQPQLIDYMYSFSEDENIEDKEGGIQDNSSLIDKFLKNQPRIIPKNHSERNLKQEDISQKSIEDKEFMSETLAKIYLKQKNYDKAMKIYQKLSLKYPQKSIYFANQIKEIQQLINNN